MFAEPEQPHFFYVPDTQAEADQSGQPGQPDASCSQCGAWTGARQCDCHLRLRSSLEWDFEDDDALGQATILGFAAPPATRRIVECEELTESYHSDDEEEEDDSDIDVRWLGPVGHGARLVQNRHAGALEREVGTLRRENLALQQQVAALKRHCETLENTRHMKRLCLKD